MGRKSKLTPAQWATIERRLLEDEPRRAIARDYDISERSIREHFEGKVEDVKSVAQKIVAAEVAKDEASRALQELPPLARKSANNLAEKLRSISDSLASAGQLGAATAHRLNALANSEVTKIDDANPLGSGESLKGVMVLTRLANDSASIALNLLAANKETVVKLNLPSPEEQTPQRPQISREQWLKEHRLA